MGRDETLLQAQRPRVNHLLELSCRWDSHAVMSVTSRPRKSTPKTPNVILGTNPISVEPSKFSLRVAQARGVRTLVFLVSSRQVAGRVVRTLRRSPACPLARPSLESQLGRLHEDRRESGRSEREWEEAREEARWAIWAGSHGTEGDVLGSNSHRSHRGNPSDQPRSAAAQESCPLAVAPRGHRLEPALGCGRQQRVECSRPTAAPAIAPPTRRRGRGSS